MDEIETTRCMIEYLMARAMEAGIGDEYSDYKKMIALLERHVENLIQKK